MPKLAPICINLDTMFGIVMDDNKSRFQLGVLVAAPVVGTPWDTDRSQKLRVHAIYAMRAVNGHSIRIDQKKIAAPLEALHADLISALTHKTQSCNIPNII